MSSSILIFVPAFGETWTTTTVLTTHALRDKLAQVGISSGISSLSFPDISELRSMATTLWYDTQPNITHLLFVDSDMGFSPDLVMEMLAFGEPVVGTVYPQRKYPQSWAGSGTGSPTTERRGNFMHVEGVGMGCTLISREAIRIMLEKFPEMVDTRLDMHPMGPMIKNTGATRLIRCFEKIDLPDRGVVSEDLSFCIRWNECGGRVWANCGHFMNHVGKHDFGGRYLDVVEQAVRESVRNAGEQLTNVDPVFTPNGAPSTPAPGGGREMPGGPSYRDPEVIREAAQKAITAAEYELLVKAEADIKAVADYVINPLDTFTTIGKHPHIEDVKPNGGEPPKRKRGRPRKNDEVQVAA